VAQEKTSFFQQIEKKAFNERMGVDLIIYEASRFAKRIRIKK
jgi:hypothetical protein